MYKPVYQITPTILSSISEIAEIKAVVERSRVLPLNEAQLRRQAIVRMAHTSTSIEGNKLAEYQVDQVLSGMSVKADEQSIKEVKNYQAAIAQMEVLASKRKTLTLSLILELHGILMQGLLEKNKAGHFRPGEIYIVDDLGNGREKLRYQGPPPGRVAHLVNELLKWLVAADRQELHPIIKAGIFHDQFVSIHPFSDGNGRMTRLLTAYALYKDGWDFRKIIVLEDYYNRDRQAYYNALNTVQGTKYREGQDISSWLEYFTLGFLVEARKVAEAISMIGFGKLEEPDSQVFVTQDEARIMDFLTTNGSLRSEDVVETLGIAKRTSQLKLKSLLDKGLIKSEGRGPSTYYVLRD